jgi:glyoxylase-like metal-dependent hydrolase (beta-lactamase superfamily II)
LEPGLTGLRCDPQVGIGPVGYLVATPAGNLLWDCPAFVDEAIVAEIGRRGGLAVISASHPHFYAAMADWSDAFGGVPIRLPAADQQWITRPHPAIEHWEDRVDLLPGLTAIRCGGHFDGSSVLHWPAGAGGRGALFTGDTIMVAPDRGWVSFMRSYPNLVPLSPSAVERITSAVEALAFDRIYGNPGWDKLLAAGAKEAVARSRARYLDAIR